MLIAAGARGAYRSVVKLARAAVLDSCGAYFALSRNARSLGPAWSSAAMPVMRRSRSTPGLGLAPARPAISRTLSPFPRVKKKGSFMPVPMAAPQARSEFRTAAEAELLDPVVGFLREPEGITQAQRPERGFPNQTHTDRAAHVHCIVDRTRHRIGEVLGAKGRTDITRDDLASGGGGRSAPLNSQRAGHRGRRDPDLLLHWG